MKKYFTTETICALSGRKKLCYIWDYYKFPLILLCIFLYIAVSALHNRMTGKDSILYTALVNVVAGEELTGQLGNDYIDYLGLDASKKELTLYTGLYLTDDELNAYHEYAYASRMKILASIEGRLLDIVLMNREAFDAFSQNGYLCNLEELLLRENPDLYKEVKNCLTDGILILEDNSSDRIFDASIPYRAVTEEYPMGLEISQWGIIAQAGFDEPVYLGIIANSPRMDAAISYLEYLLSGDTDLLHCTQTQTAHTR